MDLKALYSISYGLYLITSKDGDQINGQIANTVFQISSDPPTIAVSINKQNLTNDFIKKSGLFAVSVLREETPISLIGQFGFKSGRDMNKFADVNYRTTPRGLPYLVDDALAAIEAKLIQDVDAGTHTIFIGEITAAEVLKQGNPMTYAYYHQVKKGSTLHPLPLISKRMKGETAWISTNVQFAAMNTTRIRAIRKTTSSQGHPSKNCLMTGFARYVVQVRMRLRRSIKRL